MTCRFTIDGQSYDFRVDAFDLHKSEVRGDQWIMLDNSMKSDIIGVDVKLRIQAAWEQVAGPSITAGELWRTAIEKSNSDIPTEFTPDVDSAFTIDLYPDISQPISAFRRRRKGMVRRAQTLRFRSAKTYAPGDQQLIDLAALQDTL